MQIMIYLNTSIWKLVYMLESNSDILSKKLKEMKSMQWGSKRICCFYLDLQENPKNIATCKGMYTCGFFSFLVPNQFKTSLL